MRPSHLFNLRCGVRLLCVVAAVMADDEQAPNHNARRQPTHELEPDRASQRHTGQQGQP